MIFRMDVSYDNALDALFRSDLLRGRWGKSKFVHQGMSMRWDQISVTFDRLRELAPAEKFKSFCKKVVDGFMDGYRS